MIDTARKYEVFFCMTFFFENSEFFEFKKQERYTLCNPQILPPLDYYSVYSEFTLALPK